MNTYNKIWENINIHQIKSNTSISNVSSNIKIIFVLMGEISIQRESEWFLFSTGEFFLVPNYTDISLCFNQQNSKVYLLDLVYYLSYNENSKLIISFEGDSKNKGESKQSTLSLALIKLLHYYYLERKKVTYADIQQLYFLILSKLEKKYMVMIERKKTSLNKQIITHYIDQHYKEDLSLQSVANELFVSKQTLIRFFKKELNQSFGKYIQNRRFLEFTKLLTTSSEQISTLAYKSGFKNLNSFNRLFKNKYGITPKQWRLQHSEPIQVISNETKVVREEANDFYKTVKNPNEYFILDTHTYTQFKMNDYVVNTEHIESVLDTTKAQCFVRMKNELDLNWIRYPFRNELSNSDIYLFALNKIEKLQLYSHIVLSMQLEATFDRLVHIVSQFFKNDFGANTNKLRIELQFDIHSPENLHKYFKIKNTFKKISNCIEVGIGNIPINNEQTLNFLSSFPLDQLDFLTLDYIPKIRKNSNYSLRENIVQFSKTESLQEKYANIFKLFVNKTPLILNNFSITGTYTDEINDSHFIASFFLSFLKKNYRIFDTIGLGYLYDTDIYQNNLKEFTGSPGLFSKSQFPKATFFAAAFWKKLKTHLLINNENIIATKSNNSYVLLATNYKPLKNFYSSDRNIKLTEYKESIFHTNDKTLQIKINNIEPGNYRISTYVFSENDGNAMDVSKKYSGLQTFDTEMIHYLKQNITPTLYQRDVNIHSNFYTDKIIIKSDEIALFIIKPI